MEDIANLEKKILKYNEIVENTRIYRQAWKDGLKKEISSTLQEVIDNTSLEAEITMNAASRDWEIGPRSLGLPVHKSGSSFVFSLDTPLRPLP